jgi:AraC family transcriptional regulator
MEKMAGDDTPRAHDLWRLSPLYIRDDVVFQIGRSMLNACTAPRPFALEFSDGLGSALVAHLLGSYFVEPGIFRRLSLSPFALRRVTQYVHDHLSEEITVIELASVAGLGGSHFAHAFRASTGEPPHSFITSVRVQKAQELLRGTKKPISEIAVDCGFKDPSHFSRVFRASVGVTPRDFRLYQSGS